MPAALKPAAEQRLVLYNVSWEAYEGLLRALGERSLRHTYVEGTLELVSPSKRHESAKLVIHDLVATLCRLLQLPRQALGSTTFKHKGMLRGLEPDDCFYIGSKSVARSRRRKTFDPSRDAPPDLAIEVDISRTSLSRMGLYARLGIGEVWRYNDRTMRFFRLTKSEQYREVKRSSLFSWLAPDELARFVALRDQLDDTELQFRFETWVREQIEL